ncbi:MAG: cytochrome c oxidase subunit II [Betaproteobacteria bacterium]|jgi:cytochrome c oxidase subunit 2|nr:MAG: cytochrome c oxidase subunit II [Betaproteobacteria bacterium]
MRLKAFLRLLGSGAALLLPAVAVAEWRLNLKPAATAIGRDIYDLHTLVMIIITVIFIGVFGFMFYAIVKHRKSVGHKAEQFHESTTVEIIWTVIPVFILIGMAWPATKALLTLRDTSAPDMTIKVTGYQWKWGYEYLDDGIQFYSTLATPREQIQGDDEKGENYLLEVDNPLVVPVGKKVRILTTANDVLHAWFVQELAVKQDAIPGFIRDTWFRAERTGTFRGQCAELCGKEHGFMPIVVKVVSEDDYRGWVETKKAGTAVKAFDPGKTYSVAELRSTGEGVYNTHCVACHQTDGGGMPPTFPAITGGKIATGPTTGHIDIVVNGSKKNPMMAAWGPQLTDVEIAAVITYQRNALGNALGDAVQPGAIAAARK